MAKDKQTPQEIKQAIRVRRSRPGQVFRFHLDQDYCSGRAVRIRALGPSEKEEAEAEAAAMVGTEPKPGQFNRRLVHEEVRRMLVAVTKADDLTAEQVQTLPDSEWQGLDQSGLETPGSPTYYDKWFTAADDELLRLICQEIHHVSQAQVQAVMGKALPVSGD